MEIRALLADDHEIVRQGIRMSIEKVSDITIVGEASNGQEALDLIHEHNPNLIVADISMPIMSGIELCRVVQKQYPKINTLILSTHLDEKYVIESFKAGAKGYLPKDASVKQIIQAIETVVSGEIFYTPTIAHILATAAIKENAPSEKEVLTEREKEILTLIVEGRINKEIADVLFISSRTVDVHRRNIMRKLEVNNTAELVRKTFEKELLK